MSNPYVKPGTSGVDLKDLSYDEMHKLKTAIKKPEFLGLMNDYMLEISDPKNKDEYDQYLEQMANEGELPKGLKLVRPDPEFCIKTYLIAKTDKAQDQKLFVNICSSTVVGRPNYEIIEKDGQRGQSWNLPYSAGKMRYDQDKKGTVCNTIDIAYHPFAFQQIKKNPKLHELICQTGLEGAQKQMGERNEDISKDYKVLKRVKCKGNTPALLTVRVSGKTQSQQEQRQGGEGQNPKLYNEIMEQKEQHQKENQKQDESNQEVVIEDESNNKKEEEDEENVELNEDGSRPIQVPKYQFIYSYPVEYSDFLENIKRESKRPIAIGINIKLPSVKSIKDIKVDINEKNFLLSVPGKYFLDKELPYHVKNEEGTATFDAKKKILKIKVPINKEKYQQIDINQIKLTKADLEEGEFQSIEDQNEELKQQKLQKKANQGEEKKTQYQQIEDQDNVLEIGDGKKVGLHFVNEQQKQAFIADDSNQFQQIEKPVIEEIKPLNQLEGDNQQILIKENEIQQIKIKIQELEYITQEDEEKFFIIINIPNYQKENLKYLIFDKQVFLKYQDSKNIKYILLESSKEFEEKQSECKMVTDYIVFNLEKSQKQDFWEKNVVQKKQISYDIFVQSFEESQEAKKFLESQNIVEEEIQMNKQNGNQDNNLNELEGQEKPQLQENIQGNKQETNSNDNQLQTQEQNENQNELQQQSQEEISQKNILQFIDFEAVNFVYEID